MMQESVEDGGRRGHIAGRLNYDSRTTNQAAHFRKIKAVQVPPAGIDALGGFKDLRNGAEPPVIEQVSETRQPDFALSDVLVAIDTASTLAV